MSRHSYLATPCLHPLDASHRKICDECGALWESCYPCLLAGFRYRGREWHCRDCQLLKPWATRGDTP